MRVGQLLGRLTCVCLITLSFPTSSVVAFLPNPVSSRRGNFSPLWERHRLFQQHQRLRQDQQRFSSQGGAGQRRKFNRNQERRPSSDAFLETMALLRSARSPDDIWQWFEQQQQQRLEQQPLDFHPQEQTAVIRELAAKHAYDAILLFLHHFSDHSVYVYTSAISSLSKATSTSSSPANNRYSKQALALLQDMVDRGVRPNKFTFTALFNHIRGPSEAQHYFQSLEQEYAKEMQCLEVYNAAIHACTRRRRRSSSDNNKGGGSSGDTSDNTSAWQTALQFYLQMKEQGLIPNRPTYSSLLKVCGQAGQVKIAMSLLEDMPMPPNAVVWGAALTVCAKAGDVERATQLLQLMQKQQQTHDDAIPTTTRHVSAYIAALAKAGHDELALKILDGLKRNQAVALNDEGMMLTPVPLDLVIVNTVIYACAQAGNYADARRILSELKNDEYVTEEGTSIRPDEITYNTVISSCTDAREAKALVKEMRFSRRHRYDQVPPTAKTYTAAISACKSDLDTALFLLHDAKHDGIDPPNVFMYSATIWTAERCGRVDDALSLLTEMKEVGVEPNDVSYGGVIAALAEDGQPEAAIELLAEMKSAGIRTNEKIFSRLYEAVQIAVVKEESPVNVLGLLESIVDLMSGNDFSVRIAGPILEALILEYGMNDRYDDALRVFERIYGSTNGPCLRAILSACALTKDRWEDALAILHTSDIVEGAGGPARVDMRAIGFAMLACSKSSQWEEAMNILELYGRQDATFNNAATVPRSAVNSLITACGRGGRPDVALQLLNEMKSRYGVKPNEVSYRSAAIACNQAQHEISRRQDQGLGGNDDSEGGQSLLQWWECSLSLLRRMEEEGLQSDAQTHSSVISACEAAGEWQRALGVLRDMPGELNLYCFNAAISACQKGGAWVEALELYYQMMEKGGAVTPTFVTLSCLLIALDEAGQKELAQDLYQEGLTNNVMRPPWTRTTRSASATGELIRAMDLHNFSVAMARAAIRSTLESFVSDGKRPAHDITKELVIVVGKGKGSKSDPVLMPTVTEILDEDYSVPCHIDPRNAGRLIVTAADLQAFVANSTWRRDKK